MLDIDLPTYSVWTIIWFSFHPFDQHHQLHSEESRDERSIQASCRSFKFTSHRPETSGSGIFTFVASKLGFSS